MSWICPILSVSRILGLACCCVGALALSGCERPPARSSLVVLRVGVLPDEEPSVLEARLQILMAYLRAELDVPCRLSIPDSYEQLVSLFMRGEIDLAYLGGYTYIASRRSIGAIPLVARKRDLDFTSYFLVRTDHPARGLKDLSGLSLAFGSKMSTSGHLMPRFYLERNELHPEAFFESVRYSGAHDATAYLVRDGAVEVGAANASVIDSMFRDGRLLKREVRVLWETPPYPNYTWAAHPDLDRATLDAVRDAFLKLSTDHPDHAAVLGALDASYYLPVEPGAFQDLEQTAIQLGLLD
ncbi:MAG: phosphate/phosphite/phosphonate ABC transporter substrate-binding protein [Planctomycetota bacterium]|jgi:phosphonate transport system substrate-binding protein